MSIDSIDLHVCRMGGNQTVRTPERRGCGASWSWPVRRVCSACRKFPRAQGGPARVPVHPCVHAADTPCRQMPRHGALAGRLPARSVAQHPWPNPLPTARGPPSTLALSPIFSGAPNAQLPKATASNACLPESQHSTPKPRPATVPWPQHCGRWVFRRSPRPAGNQMQAVSSVPSPWGPWTAHGWSHRGLRTWAWPGQPGLASAGCRLHRCCTDAAHCGAAAEKLAVGTPSIPYTCTPYPLLFPSPPHPPQATLGLPLILLLGLLLVTSRSRSSFSPLRIWTITQITQNNHLDQRHSTKAQPAPSSIPPLSPSHNLTVSQSHDPTNRYILPPCRAPVQRNLGLSEVGTHLSSPDISALQFCSVHSRLEPPPAPRSTFHTPHTLAPQQALS